MVLVAVAVAAPVAYAKVVNGTGGDDLLVGTNNADEITGRGGDDRTRGKQGDDTYNYASGWGRDVVVDSGGRDGLDFRRSTRTWSPTCARERRSTTRTWAGHGTAPATSLGTLRG